MPFANRVTIMGNVTRDPELAFTNKGTAKLELGLAINRTYTVEGTGEKREEVVFVDVIFWKNQAENVAKYTRKGRNLYIEGSLIMDSWDDKTTGQRRTKLRVKADSYQFIGPSNAGGDGGGEDAPPATGQSRPASRPASTQRPPTPSRPAEPAESAETSGDGEDGGEMF